MADEVFEAGALRALAVAILRAAGAPDDVAAAVADHLVESNLVGHDSHGVIRLPEYVARARSGAVVAAARPVVDLDRGALARVSGEWGFGQVTGALAIDQAIERARAHGIAAVGMVRCNHLGRIGSYMERAANAGFVGLAWVGGLGGTQLAVPFGGAGGAYGTNPIAAGFPAGESGPLLVDFATTAIAGGKVMVAHAKGEAVPPGSIVDKDGNPTTSTSDFLAGGFLLPFGGHKGYALAVLAELMGQALTGGDETTDEGHGGAPYRSAGATFVAIDAGAFRPAEVSRATAEKTVQRLRATRPAPGFQRVMTPGEPESTSRARRQSAGIPLPAETWRAITETATQLGIPVP